MVDSATTTTLRNHHNNTHHHIQRRRRRHRIWAQIALFVTSVTYLMACPYSKVEESFNVQATYDLFTYGLSPALFSSNGWMMSYNSILKNDTSAQEESQQQQPLPYDHLQYPGVVPRTFTGPLILSTACHIIRWMMYPILDIANYPKVVQFLARFLLLMLILSQWYALAAALDQRTSTNSNNTNSNNNSNNNKNNNTLMGTYMLWIATCQFHIPFYASRMLPNTFACVLTLRCYVHWLRYDPTVPKQQQKHQQGDEPTATKGGVISEASAPSNRIHAHNEFESMGAAIDMVIATVLFRCDCIMLLFTVGLSWLITRQLTVLSAIQIGLITTFGILAITIPIDSILWQRYTWPEGEVLFFNTILNKSSDWGISPWYWYWTNALPKALLGSVIFIPFAVFRLPLVWTTWEQHGLFRGTTLLLRQSSVRQWIDTTWLPQLLPALGFVILYSFLGHKEVRFLFPALPLFNVAAAAGLYRLHQAAYPDNTDPADSMKHDKKKKPPPTLLSRLAYLMAILVLVMSAFASISFVAISYWNYPGGDALEMLSRHIQHSTAPIATVTTPTNGSSTTPIVRVYIDVAAAMTGVNLFGQHSAAMRNPNYQWSFEKAGYEQENELVRTDKVEEWMRYTHLLMESDELAKSGDDNFRVVNVAQGKPRLDIRQRRIVTTETIFVLERTQQLE